MLYLGGMYPDGSELRWSWGHNGMEGTLGRVGDESQAGASPFMHVIIRLSASSQRSSSRRQNRSPLPIYFIELR